MKKTTPLSYHPVLISMHWLVFLLVISALVLGKYMSTIPNNADKIPFIGIHMLIGLLILLAMTVRLVARLRLPKIPYASTGNKLLDFFGKVVHIGLYLFVFLMAISGISLSTQSGLAQIVFGGGGLSLPEDFYVFSARVLHGFISPVLLGLILIHVAAAFYHQLILKDNLFSRMSFKK